MCEVAGKISDSSNSNLVVVSMGQSVSVNSGVARTRFGGGVRPEEVLVVVGVAPAAPSPLKRLPQRWFHS